MCCVLRLPDCVTASNPFFIVGKVFPVAALAYFRHFSRAKTEAFPHDFFKSIFFKQRACFCQLAGTASDTVGPGSLLNSVIGSRCLPLRSIIRDTQTCCGASAGTALAEVLHRLSTLAARLKHNMRFQSSCTFASRSWLRC